MLFRSNRRFAPEGLQPKVCNRRFAPEAALHSVALPERSSGYPRLALHSEAVQRSSVGPLHSEAVQGLGFQAAEGLQGRFSPAPTASKSKAGGLKTDGFVRQSKALHANLRFAKRSADLLQIEDLHGSNCRPTFGLLRQGSIQRSKIGRAHV